MAFPDYDLPKRLIAQRPAADRAASRLMVLRRSTGEVEHRVFRDLPGLLSKDDVMVVNDTRVIPARLYARRATGGRVDVLLVRREGAEWRAMLDGRAKTGDVLHVDGAELRVLGREDGLWRLEAPADILERGEPPLPPYVKRGAPDPADRERYQTVYAREEGSIAAPTAGLHFTKELLAAMPCEVASITCHIGPGTFQPVRGDVAEHRMLAESYRMPAGLELHGRRVVAVGTSVTRTLESFARTGRREDATDLFIRPPFEFKIVGALVTNFHLPRGTPLCLAAAFAGIDALMRAYEEAMAREYRFYSYGDAMLVL